MKPYRIAHRYNRLNTMVFSLAHDISKGSSTQGRLLGIPLGIFMLVSLPVAKIAQLLEAVFCCIVSLLSFALADLGLSLRATGTSVLGILMSPISAIFSAIGIWTAMMVDPLKACERFVDTCQGHHSAYTGAQGGASRSSR